MMSRRNPFHGCGAGNGTRVPRWRAGLTRLALCVAVLVSAPTLVAAQSTVDTYLHGSGGTANPPNLFLDPTAPTASTAKYKDSSSINFNGGNAWQLVGTWPTSSVPTAGKLTALTSVHAWLGLKNSDDQGTNFDLLAEVYKDGDLVTSGLTRCRTGITTNPASALETLVAFGSFASASLNGTSDTLSVKIWTRIGTNADNTKCAGHNNAVGLRLYFDATTRAARLGLTLAPPDPTPSALTPNPLAITVGATGTLTATLTPAPPAAGSLTVSSANTGVATVPASVAFAANQTQIPIPVNGVGVGNALITVSLNGGTVTSTVEVNPPSLTITNLSPATLAITQGATGTLTVSISAAQQTNTTVTLTSSAPSIAFVPAQVVVPANLTTAPITVSANTPGSAVITASLNGSQAASTVTVTPALPTIVSLQPPMLPITLGASGVLTVTLSATQPSATTIAVTASPAGLVTVPATVSVLANQLSTTIPVGTVAMGTAMVHVSLNGSMAESAVHVTPPPPTVVALSPSPLTVVVGATGQLTVMLSAAQPTNITVTLAVDNPTVIQVPSSVPVPANQTQAQFTVTGLATGTAVVTATLGTSSQQATVQVVPSPPQVVSLLPNPLPLQQGATGSLTLTINAAQPTDTVVPLTNNQPTLVQAPPSETVPAGQTQTTVSVTGLLTGNAVLTATLNGSSVSTTVQVTPPPPVVTALGPVPPTPSPLTLPKGKPGVLRVTLSRAPTAPTTVTLTSTAPTIAAVPASVPVPAGALTADFPVNTVGQGTATITASLNGGSANANVVVTAPEVDAVTLSPLTPSVFVGESVPFTVTATMTDGTTQPITTNLTWTSSSTAVATIDNTGLATTLTAGTTTIKAATTNSLGPVTDETTLTVQPAAALTLTPTVTTLLVGQATTLTITSAAPAPTGGLVVTLTPTGTGSVTVVGSATIPATQSSVQVVVSGATPGLVTVTGTAIGRIPGSTQFTVNLPLPTITGFTPTTGTVGTVVTITGTNFATIAQGGTTVRFNGTAAVATSVTPTSITTTVPLGAITGNISAQTSGGTATSATPFTVTLSVDFQVSSAPGTTMAVQGQSATTLVKLTGPVGFANLVNLTVNGLPAGVTVTTNPQVVTLNQPVTLTVTTSGTTPVGTSTITVTGTTTIDGQSVARSASLSLTVASSGGTTLEGRVLRADDDVPLQGVTLKIGAITTQTDAAGRFFFATAPAGTQIMMIDGTTVTNPPGTYHTLPAQVNLVANQANVLPFVSYLPLVDTTVKSHIDPATTSIVQDPRIPGLSFTIPTGTELRSDLDGSLITDIAITPVSPSRIPLPPPGPGLHIDPGTIYMMYFFKPGGAIPSQKITQFSLPNDLASAPGRNIIFYYFDSSPTVQPGTNQWKLAGTGKISADGKLALPDPGVGFPKFCCALIFWCNAAGATEGNTSPDNNTDLDPVDLATGQFVLRKTDFALNARLPITIGRGYQGGRKVSAGPFGKGTFFNFEKEAQSTEGGLVITYAQGNGRIDLLTRQPDGTFQNTTIRSLRGLVLTVNADGSKTIRRKDRSIERFGTSGRLIGLEDRNGNTITIERGGNDLITRIVDASGLRALIFQYDAAGRIQQITDPINRTIQYVYNASGYLETITDTAGGITRYTYDASGNLLTITDARGILYLTSEYDSAGRVIRQTLADGGVYTAQYGTFGTTITDTTVTDPRGNATTTRFNAQNYSAVAVDRLGQQTRKTFDSNNQVTEVRDQLNRVTQSTYDPAGNVTSILDPQGNATLFEYESTFNRVTKLTDALTQSTRFTYDPVTGNLLTTTDPLTHATAITYNQFGQPIAVTDALGHVTQYEYDEVGNLIATIDPLGNRTLRFYDAVSRLISLIDPRGKTTQFTYDTLNRVIQIQDAINGVTAFTYDPNGNLLTVTDAKNQVTTYTYDNMDRLATRKDALNRTESYQYDLAGNLTTFTDRKNQAAQFQYDALNRRTSTTYADATTTFTYDTVGRLVKASDTAPNAGTIEFGYDILNRLIQETTGQGTVNYQYDILGRRTQMVANGQQPVTYNYDPASRLTQVAQGSVYTALGYDNANRRTSLGYSNGTTTGYAYDLASRLTNITHNGPSGLIEALTYSYDATGNRFGVNRANGTASLLPNAVASATYDAANEQMAFAGSTLTYDANGNLTNDGVNTYQWNARNRLIAISGGASANFSYDVLGRRTSKTINSVASQFLYDGKDIVAEIGGGAVGASFLRSLNIDEPFIRQTSTGNEHYHSDALGSSLALSNVQGASATTYTYEPFGRTTVTGTSSSPFQYTGRENDGTGLYYYRSRYYSPMRQRFVTEDPVKSRSKGFSLYEYVSGNPLRFIDPLGLEQFETCTHSGGCGLPIDIPPSIDPEHVRNSIIERWPPTSPLDDLLDRGGELFKNAAGDVLEDEAVRAARRVVQIIIEGAIEGCFINPAICILIPKPGDAEAFFPGPESIPPLGVRK